MSWVRSVRTPASWLDHELTICDLIDCELVCRRTVAAVSASKITYIVWGVKLGIRTFRSQDFSLPGAKVPHGNFRSVEL